MFRNTQTAFIFSIILHLGILLFFVLSFEFSSTMPVVQNSDQDMKVISAVVMDAPKVPPHLSETPPQPKVETPKPPAPQPIVKPEPKPLPKSEPQIKVQAKPVQEAIALTKPKIKPKERNLEKDMMAEIKQQKIKTKKSFAKNMEKALQTEAQKSLDAQIKAMEAEAAGAKVRGVVDKYKALILQAISERWLVPPGIDKKLYAILLIRLAPGGSVLDVQITKSSGVLALDRSAQDAVYKASPLPVPEDSASFDRLRQIELKVRPEDLISNNG